MPRGEDRPPYQKLELQRLEMLTSPREPNTAPQALQFNDNLITTLRSKQMLILWQMTKPHLQMEKFTSITYKERILLAFKSNP